jgi:S1-C subfamily serine protease
MKPAVRGTEVLFAGFPHGIPHLLVQRAAVAGILNDVAFYIDGSVNGGNSGGPILDTADGSVIGIVTQRRFLGAQDLQALGVAAKQIQAHCQAMAGRGGVQIMGIDFGGFSNLMAQGMQLIQEVLEANANTGIGIGFSIEFVAAKCAQLGIQ